MDYERAARSVAGLVPRTASEERRAAVARAFSLAEIAYRVAGLDETPDEDVSSGGRTSYIKKEKGKYCVKSRKNPDWSGGCYDTKGEAEDRLKQVEMFKHMGADLSGQGDWIPAAGGAEEPFVTRGGKRLQYMWNPTTGEHAYLDLDNDLILSEEESRAILGSSGLRSPSSPKEGVPLTDEQEEEAYNAGYEAASGLSVSGKWSGDLDDVFLWVMGNDPRVPSVTEDDPSFWEWRKAVHDGATDFAQSKGLKLSTDESAGITFKSAPEYKSIEDFVEFKMDDEEDEFDHEDLAALSYRLKSSPGKVRKMLEGYGLKLKEREPEKKARGFQSPDHDRWYGPGSAPTHGGGGSGTKWIPSAV